MIKLTAIKEKSEDFAINERINFIYSSSEIYSKLIELIKSLRIEKIFFLILNRIKLLAKRVNLKSFFKIYLSEEIL